MTEYKNASTRVQTRLSYYKFKNLCFDLSHFDFNHIISVCNHKLKFIWNESFFFYSDEKETEILRSNTLNVFFLFKRRQMKRTLSCLQYRPLLSHILCLNSRRVIIIIHNHKNIITSWKTLCRASAGDQTRDLWPRLKSIDAFFRKLCPSFRPGV